MAIPKGHKANFETLTKAFDNNNVCLMECIDKVTKKPVQVICMVNVIKDPNMIVKDEYEFVPVAKMFSGNPYEEVSPPK
jgi:hypothetical protein